ncbi:MAG: hypothetical protein ACI7YS_07980 [Flavobacterium sp.]
MEVNELNYKERGLIEILRTFSFLHQENYTEKEVSLGGRDNPSVIYHNWIKDIVVKIIGDESQSWTVVIQRKKLFVFGKDTVAFDISDYYELLGSGMVQGRNYTLKSQADFIQTYLMPVIRGEKWIDEIV